MSHPTPELLAIDPLATVMDVTIQHMIITTSESLPINAYVEIWNDEYSTDNIRASSRCHVKTSTRIEFDWEDNGSFLVWARKTLHVAVVESNLFSKDRIVASGEFPVKGLFNDELNKMPLELHSASSPSKEVWGDLICKGCVVRRPMSIVPLSASPVNSITDESMSAAAQLQSPSRVRASILSTGSTGSTTTATPPKTSETKTVHGARSMTKGAQPSLHERKQVKPTLGRAHSASSLTATKMLPHSISVADAGTQVVAPVVTTTTTRAPTTKAAVASAAATTATAATAHPLEFGPTSTSSIPVSQSSALSALYSIAAPPPDPKNKTRQRSMTLPAPVKTESSQHSPPSSSQTVATATSTSASQPPRHRHARSASMMVMPSMKAVPATTTNSKPPLPRTQSSGTNNALVDSLDAYSREALQNYYHAHGDNWRHVQAATMATMSSTTRERALSPTTQEWSALFVSGVAPGN